VAEETSRCIGQPLPIEQHWLLGCDHQRSPNQSARPSAIDISLLVIHNISLPPKQFGGDYVRAFFCNQLEPSQHPYFVDIASLQVSAHLFIRRDGNVVQFVGFDRKAWHAGISCFNGRDACNDFSIGIELEGADDIPYTDSQYTVLSDVTKALMLCYPLITPHSIVGHSDIAPGRKTDPGPAFDWSRYRHLLSI